MSRSRALYCILLLLVLLPITPVPTAADNESTYAISVNIIEAYYTSMDGEEIQDDVVILTNFEIIGDNLNSFHYILELELPTGLSHLAYVFVITSSTSFSIQNVFYNTATEEGWYTSRIVVELINGNVWDNDERIFDPPGSDGGKPLVFAATII